MVSNRGVKSTVAKQPVARNARELKDTFAIKCAAAFDPSYRLFWEEVEGDGSCFFHAACAVMDFGFWQTNNKKNRTEIGHTFRHIVCGSLANWPAFWKKRLPVSQHGSIPDVGTIKEKFKNIKTWADIWLISWVMYRLNITCVFFDGMSDGRIFCGASGEADGTHMVMIKWVRRSHFVPVYCFDGSHMRTNFPSSHPFAKHLRKTYRAECPVGSM